MKKLFERIMRPGAKRPPDKGTAVVLQATPRDIPEDNPRAASQPTTESKLADPKPPPSLPLFFMLSHLEEDGPVRPDGVKAGVCEVTGLEIDEPKLGAFAGALNALDFPVQLLIRQHPPRLARLREKAERSPAKQPSPSDAGGLGVTPRSAGRP